MDELLSALKGAAEPTRLRILGLLGHGELTVSELVEILAQSQPRVSRHLRLMVEAGLLSRFREGTWVFYRLADSGKARHMINHLLPLLVQDPGDLARDFEKLKYLRLERAEKAADYFRENALRWNEVRSLYVPEKQVEEGLISLAGDAAQGAILDVGTGTGRMLEIFKDQFTAAVGVDLSRDMLAVADDRLSAQGVNNYELRLGDMYNLPVADNSKSLVIFHQVLHFADDPLQAIRQAAETLTTDGVILIADFAPHQLEFLRDDHAHRRLGFADSEVEVWAETAGLTLSQTKEFKGDELDVKIWRLERKTLS